MYTYALKPAYFLFLFVHTFSDKLPYLLWAALVLDVLNSYLTCRLSRFPLMKVYLTAEFYLSTVQVD